MPVTNLKPVALTIVMIYQKARKCRVWKKYVEPLPGYAPQPMKGFSYSYCCLVPQSSTCAMLSLGFDIRSHIAAVSEFVEAGSVKNRNFWTFSPHPTDFRDQSLMLRNPGRDVCVRKVSVRSVAAVCEKWPVTTI